MRTLVQSKICEGSQLSFNEALWCMKEADLWDLGKWAQQVRSRYNPANRVTYQVDRNINYTNICISRCHFCAFSKPPGDSQGWVLSIAEICKKVEETLAAGGTGILLQGGINPAIPFEYYTELLETIRSSFANIHIHAFSPPEIIGLCRTFKMKVRDVLKRLIDAGLDSMPGGGAEILSESTRKRVSPGKCRASEWLEVMEICHSLGLKSTATMVIGLGETLEERLNHLISIRDLQDKTNGFTAFILWTLQPENTRLHKKVQAVGAVEYLRMLACARIILDNIAHHQVSWLTQGLQLGSLGLQFGADDFSSVMIEENVLSAAGIKYRTNESELRLLIKNAGFKPVKRLTLYQNIHHG